MRQVPRAILPAAGGDERPITGAIGTSPRLPKKRRISSGVACDNCRSSKLSCDRMRPACGRCWKRAVECKYATRNKNDSPRKGVEDQLAVLQDRLKQHEDMLQHLRSVPDDEALVILHKLRATPDVAEVLSSIRRSPSPQWPSEPQATQALLLPVTESEVDFELMMLHANVYASREPLSDTAAVTAAAASSSVDLSSIFLSRAIPIPELASTNSVVLSYEASPSSSPSRMPAIRSADSFQDLQDLTTLGPPSPLRGVSEPRLSPLPRPLRSRICCDARLENLDAECRTRVPVGNEYAATLLSIHWRTSTR